jgi:hypothetical protein
VQGRCRREPRINLTADGSGGEAPAGDASDSGGSLEDFIVPDSDDGDAADGGGSAAPAADKTKRDRRVGGSDGAGGAGEGSKRHKGGVEKGADEGVGRLGRGGAAGREKGADEGRDSDSDSDSDEEGVGRVSDAESDEARLGVELFGLVSRGDAAGLSGFLGRHPTAARWSGPDGLEGAAGVPALHWAVMQRQSDCVALLAKAGAQVSLPLRHNCEMAWHPVNEAQGSRNGLRPAVW